MQMASRVDPVTESENYSLEQTHTDGRTYKQTDRRTDGQANGRTLDDNAEAKRMHYSSSP